MMNAKVTSVELEVNVEALLNDCRGKILTRYRKTKEILTTRQQSSNECTLCRKADERSSGSCN